jgi:VWFA-related protein
VLFSLLASAVAAPAQQPQQSQRPTSTDSEEVLRVTTELVQTDVSVFDKEGKFVDNLKREQFELKIDGKPQPISFFERVVAGSVNEDAQLAAARGTSRGTAVGTTVGDTSALPLDRGRVVVFFLDDLHLSPGSLVSTKKLLAQFVETQLRQNDQMAIATATDQLGFLSQLTDDKTVLREAISRLNIREQKEFDSERPQLNIVQAIAIEQGHPDVTDYFVDQTIKENPAFSVNDVGGGGAAGAGGANDSSRGMALNYIRRRARQLIDMYSSISTRTLDALGGVMRTFAQSPGRKLFYFVSDGFAIEDRRSSTFERVHQVTDAAARAGAVVYTVDARGLGAQLADLPSAADNSSPDPTGRLSGAMLSMTNATQEPLRTIADETGGRAILNTNSIALGVAKALKETSVYYLLAWKPEREENRGGKFRRVEVTVAGRSDLTVLVQHGFYSSPPEASAKRDATPPSNANATSGAGAANSPSPEQQARTKELAAALRAPFPRAGLPTALTLNYIKTKEAKVLLTASVQVEIESSKQKADGSMQTDRAELIAAIYNDQGKIVNTFQRNVGVTPKDASVVVPPTLRLSFSFQSPVEPGLYQVRVASRDPKNRRTGSASQWIEIPDVNKGAFALSSVFLGIHPPVVTPEDKAAEALGPQLLVVPDRRFTHEAPMRFLVYAYNAAASTAGTPDIAVQVQIFRDDQPVVTTPLSKLDATGYADFTRLPYVAEVSLKDVPAGRYELRITAIDRVAKASATQHIKFTVE